MMQHRVRERKRVIRTGHQCSKFGMDASLIAKTRHVEFSTTVGVWGKKTQKSVLLFFVQQ